jgi:hypothetical protein
VKLIKIRFTSWRDQSVALRSLAIQRQLDAFTTRMSVLAATAARIRNEHAHGNHKADQESLAGIAADRSSLESGRMALVSAEKAAADAETRAARAHKKAGTFGYQVLHDAGTHVAMVVDEAGDYLPIKAVYSYEVVDENPPLPEWAKKGKVGRFE